MRQDARQRHQRPRSVSYPPLPHGGGFANVTEAVEDVYGAILSERTASLLRPYLDPAEVERELRARSREFWAAFGPGWLDT